MRASCSPRSGNCDNAAQRDAAIHRAQDEARRLADPVWANMVYLVAARGAWNNHSPAQAAALLQAAQDAGMQNSIAAEEAALLAQALQKTWPMPPRRDPPLMPYFRLLSRAVLVRK
jgi:hypothetical protein